jgi:branched-subunit amino acid aminotransferase/4-amino-4-deoxychorismate lyase
VLIWVAGQIVPEDALAIPAGDRVFEHGLGLFETLRTWNGVATLLPRHLARMTRSAAELGLPLDASAMPDAGAVDQLLRAIGASGDVGLRITLSGGRSDREDNAARVWMRHTPLPPPPREAGAVVAMAPWMLAFDDPLSRHKTLNSWSKRLAHERGRAEGADEVLFATPDGLIWEGSRTNLFLVRGTTLTTPGLSGPVLPGVMRGLVLEEAAELGLQTREQAVSRDDLDSSDEVFLTNAVRGIVPVGLLRLHELARTFTIPGPWTLRLVTRIEHRLHAPPSFPLPSGALS